MELFRQKLFAYAFLVCRQVEDAEEVAQETLLKVFENLHQLKDPARVRPWVFRIARNECLMMRRRSRFAPEREISLEEWLKPAGATGGREIEDASAWPEDKVLRGEAAGALDQTIARLPEDYRSVLLLRDREELSTAETAEVLGVSVDVVRTRLHRARLAMRELLTGHSAKGRNPDGRQSGL